jgi:uncharacterized protein
MKHPIAALLLTLAAACAPADRPHAVRADEEQRAEIDHTRIGFISDPGAAPAEAAAQMAALQMIVADPLRHPTHPARNRQLVIPSGPVRPELGRPAEMNALFFTAAGEGPKPTLLLLHGLPGNERNFDLAQAVRRAGWNVLTFTYRGAWGSEGSFSIQHAIEDAAAALAFLRTPEAFQRYGVDPRRIVLAGHSMGGMAALIAAARDPYSGPEKCGRYHWGPEPIAGLILLDAWNAGATARSVRAAGPPGRAAFIAALDDLGRSLGPITAADLADELVRRGDQWDLAEHARAITGPCASGAAAMPVLSIYARHGLAAENRALAAALRAARGPRGAEVRERELDSDHAFADARVALAVEVVAWLQGLGGSRP